MTDTTTKPKRWTLAEIKAANERKGGFFFSRDTMRFWGDTMRDYGVIHEGDKVFVVRKRSGKRWLFNPSTGDLMCVMPS